LCAKKRQKPNARRNTRRRRAGSGNRRATSPHAFDIRYDAIILYGAAANPAAARTAHSPPLSDAIS
jgi:hypothetical protein